MNNDDRNAVAESLIDRMTILVSRIAGYPGQPTVSNFQEWQVEAKAIVATAKTLNEIKGK